ncbi:MAG: 3-isopropylmalate dehydrogenase, partial [Candidatus Magnetomorum sp.]|nr:3-isopropylmalate dehydrogenase [Candidatus Magnetomorum sp.]
MTSYKIAVIPGDGTGPEVVAEGVKVVKCVAEKCNFHCDFDYFSNGGDHYKATGEILSDETIQKLSTFDAIYLGAIGHPDVQPGILEKGILL